MAGEWETVGDAGWETVQPKGKLPAVIDYNPGVGTAETLLSLGSGTAGAVIGGLRGIGQAATNALGLTTTPAGDAVRETQDALTYEPRTTAGRNLTAGISAPFELLAKGADAAGGAVTDVTGSPAAGAAVNTAINMAPAALGLLARVAPKASAGNPKAAALNAPVDAQIAAARQAGLKLTPEDAGAGPVARGIGSMAGEPRLAKQISRSNAPVINDMIRRDVGLPDDIPLSREALATVRKEAGQAYEAVKGAGRVEMDARYKADLHEITKSIETAAKDFPELGNSPLLKRIDGLKVETADAGSIVEAVKLLRGEADKAFRQGDKQLGKGFKDAAEAMDAQLERHVSRTGQAPESVAAYRDARQRIAKSYAAEKALNDSSGNIDAAVYAKALKAGKKLSGEGKQVGEFASQFPRSTQRTERLGATGPTIFDAALGLVFGEPIAGQSAVARGLSGLTARPLARSVMASGPVQSAMTAPRSYGPSRIRTLQELIEQAATPASLAGIPAGQQQ